MDRVAYRGRPTGALRPRRARLGAAGRRPRLHGVLADGPVPVLRHARRSGGLLPAGRTTRGRFGDPRWGLASEDEAGRVIAMAAEYGVTIVGPPPGP